MNFSKSQLLSRIIFPSLLVAVALAIIVPFIGHGFSEMLFIFVPVAAVSAWYGDFVAGVVATVFSTTLVWYFLVEPIHSFRLDPPIGIAQLGVFASVNMLLVIWVRLQRHYYNALRETEKHQRSLAQERQKLFEHERIASERAWDLLKVRDELLALVSHEIRTPLTSIIGWTYILKKVESSPKQKAIAVEMIDKNAQLQARIVNDLLDAARLRGGKLEIQNVPVELCTVVKEALQIVEPKARAKAIQVNIDIQAEPFIMGDRGRLLQIFANILDNSVKYNHAGGKVDVLLTTKGSVVQVAFTDTGIGFRPESAPLLFEMFWQADPSKTRTAGGLGLGLSLVKNLVEMHGGTVRAFSDGELKGATFVVTLPVHTQR